MSARRLLALASVFAVVAVSAIVPAASAGAATDTGTDLVPGWKFSSSTITCPGQPTRHMDSAHTVGFVQSWYIATIIGVTTSLVEQHPPAGLPFCTIKTNDTVEGNQFTFTSFYATNGKKSWVGLPKQTIGPGAFVPTEKWWVAPPRAVLAFHGKVLPDAATSTGTTTSTTPPTTTTTPAATDDGSSGSSTGVIIAVVAGVVILGAGGLVLFRRRAAKT